MIWLIASFFLAIFAGPAKSEIMFVPRVELSDLAEVKLPADMKIVSTVANIRDHPGIEEGIVGKLKYGHPVKILAFVTGSHVCNNCKATPYNLCIEETNVWAKISFLSPDNEKSQGFCSLINLLAFPSPERRPQKYEELFHFKKLDKHGVLWDKKLEKWKLPQSHDSSYLDAIGWHNFIAKNITERGFLVVSRKEIEFFIRMSQGNNWPIFKYCGYGQRIPKYWTKFPNIIQPVLFDPGLKTIAIYNDHAEIMTIQRLTAKRYFTYLPKAYDASIPLIYEFESDQKNPLFMVLLTDKAYEAVSRQDIVVRTDRNLVQTEEFIDSTFTTMVDLNSDGQPEIARFHSIGQYIHSPFEGESDRSVATQIVMLHDGFWYITSMSSSGQEGPEGF